MKGPSETKLLKKLLHYVIMGDMNRGVKIKRDVKLYLTKSYKMAVFLCHSMFNTMTTFSADMDPFLDL